MLGRTYDGQNCSVAKSLELLGERWTLLVIREAFLGNRRFDQLAARLGVARNVLTARLARLVEAGVLERHRYQERPERFEYRLTEKGRDLQPVLLALMAWGDRYTTGPEGPPMTSVHTECDHAFRMVPTCSHCGGEVGSRNIRAVPRAAA